ncbi:MAG TPA: hypothetical protein PK022_01125 [Syntrophales bacterium]|nr:hypothetical protein [Syntrophales bacterium]
MDKIKSRLVCLVTSGIFLFTVLGCATDQYEQNTGAAVGGATGAAVGGVIGGIVGEKHGDATTGAVIGGLLGALAGAAIGHYTYDRVRNEEAAQKQYGYNYDQSQTALVRIENASVTPNIVKPGGTINLMATYTVLTEQGAMINVMETREIRYNGDLTGRPQVTLQKQGGTYTSQIPVTLPTNANPGKYTVLTIIQVGQNSDARETSFTVK